MYYSASPTVKQFWNQKKKLTAIHTECAPVVFIFLVYIHGHISLFY